MSSQPAAPVNELDDLAASLDDLSITDAARLRRALDGVRKLRDPKRRAGTLRRVERDVAAARLRIVERQAAVPLISYPPDLPVSKARDELADAIARAPGRDRRRRDRLGQDHPAAEDLPRARPRRARPDRRTPSRAGSPPARSPSASPRSSAPSSASRRVHGAVHRPGR
jgi:hypothetical protein